MVALPRAPLGRPAGLPQDDSEIVAKPAKASPLSPLALVDACDQVGDDIDTHADCAPLVGQHHEQWATVAYFVWHVPWATGERDRIERGAAED